MCEKAASENTAGPMGNPLVTRQSARGVLDNAIKRAEDHRKALRPEDEENLWKLFIKGVNRA